MHLKLLLVMSTLPSLHYPSHASIKWSTLIPLRGRNQAMPERVPQSGSLSTRTFAQNLPVETTKPPKPSVCSTSATRFELADS